MEQIWKPVCVDEGIYESLYQVSNMGLVRANPSAKQSGMKPGRILFQGRDHRGYRQVSLYANKKRKTLKVARLVMTAFVGPREKGMTIDHLNGDKSDNRLENLEYVCNSDNIRRSYGNGLRDAQLQRLAAGDWNWAKKLNMDKADEIRARVACGERRSEVAKEFGVHMTTVGEIVRNETWRK